MFFYNFNGITGKFVIDKNKTVHTIPKADLKIEVAPSPGGKFDSFVVTAPDGTKYYFGLYPDTYLVTQKVWVGNVSFTDWHHDLWYLRKIKSFDDKHEISFEYDIHSYKYYTTRECYISKYWNNGEELCGNDCGEGDDNVNLNLYINVSNRILTGITTSTDVVTFDLNLRLHSKINDKADLRKILKIDFFLK